MENDHHSKGKFWVEETVKNATGRRAFKYIFSLIPLYDYNFSGDPIKDSYSNGQRAVGLMLRGLLTREQIQAIENEKL